MRRHAVMLTIGTAVLVAVSYIGWNTGSGLSIDPFRGGSDRGQTGASAVAFDPAPKGDRVELDRLIRDYEQQVRVTPTATSLTFLAQLYVARGRLTGDVTTYVQADAALVDAIARFPKDLEAPGLRASVRYTMHDFIGALNDARGVLAVDPNQPVAMATAADAQLETGDYDGARAGYAALAAKLPHVAAVEVRQARLAFLEGDTQSARDLAASAESDARLAGIGGAGLAFYQVFRAQVALDSGRYDEAVYQAKDAAKSAPDWHVALAQLGKTLAAKGDFDGAAAAYTKAIDIVPQPDYLAALGDIETRRHHPQAAAQRYDTVQFIATLAAINRQVYNRQLVLFDADHARSADEAVNLAAAELSVRHDIYAWDAYAWALLNAGRAADAAAAVPHALALGTHDARLLYHAGMIAAATGDAGGARQYLQHALELSPHFDPLGAPRAQATLDRLAPS